MEAASFVAALAMGVTVRLLPSKLVAWRNALHVAGCIPMIPGGFAAKLLLELFDITAQHPIATQESATVAMASTLQLLCANNLGWWDSGAGDGSKRRLNGTS